jgi:hypothetical protein
MTEEHKFNAKYFIPFYGYSEYLVDTSNKSKINELGIDETPFDALGHFSLLIYNIPFTVGAGLLLGKGAIFAVDKGLEVLKSLESLIQ